MGLFTETVVEEAVIFADMAAQALRLAVRIATANLLAQDLKTAMESRTAIDLATGIIMEQNHCSQGEAFAKLCDASQTATRNSATSQTTSSKTEPAPTKRRRSPTSKIEP